MAAGSRAAVSLGRGLGKALSLHPYGSRCASGIGLQWSVGWVSTVVTLRCILGGLKPTAKSCLKLTVKSCFVHKLCHTAESHRVLGELQVPNMQLLRR